ncbi:MAG TPA: hypothetical protein VGL77_15105, partial [Armatimonadota bacterium]
GPTTWGLEDYKFYFDQLARMRGNMLLMHWYDDEPGGAYEVDGEFLVGDRAHNTLSKSWGAIERLRTSQFYFGTGAYFDEEIFGSPECETSPTTIEEIRRSIVAFSEATRYAQRAGVKVAAGFEAPRGTPTDIEVANNFRARVRQFLRRNPHLTYFALWQHESGGSAGSALPEPGTPADALFQRQRADFDYLGNLMRVWEAIRYGEFARIAYEVMKEEAPHLRMVMVGWGGDRWMHFADYCLAYDKRMPADVAFTCHDNILAAVGPNVSTPWGQLPPERERWALPWVEGDVNDCWVRQANVEILGKLAPDALRKGCQGLLTLSWRTRDVEEETGYIARFAWEPTLTPDQFYRVLARHAFGADLEEYMGERLGILQKLGARWTGMLGAAECSGMRWAGFAPPAAHVPFEINGAAARDMYEYAIRARDALAEVPKEEAFTEGGMFHMREEETQTGDVQYDMNRIGVKEFAAAAEKLEALTHETDPAVIHQGMREVEELVLQARPKIIHHGVPIKVHSPMDIFWMRLHHLNRH